jgi:hypothetical protein
LSGIRSQRPRLRLTLKPTANSGIKSRSATAGVANAAGERKIFKSITSSRGAAWAMTQRRISSLFAPSATRTLTDVGLSRETRRKGHAVNGRQGLSVSENGQRGRQSGNATPEARREVRGENPPNQEVPLSLHFLYGHVDMTIGIRRIP